MPTQNENQRREKPRHSVWQEKTKEREENPWRQYSARISRRILAALHAHNLSQREFAIMLNSTPQQVSKVLQGSENLTLETIFKYASALGVELITFPDFSFDKTSREADGELAVSAEVLKADRPKSPAKTAPDYLEYDKKEAELSLCV